MPQQHQFHHYCDKCEYLGSIPGVDFYVCRGQYGGTMLHRHGDEDPEYTSYPIGFVPQYGPKDATSFHGQRTIAHCTIANSMLVAHDLIKGRTPISGY